MLSAYSFYCLAVFFLADFVGAYLLTNKIVGIVVKTSRKSIAVGHKMHQKVL